MAKEALLEDAWRAYEDHSCDMEYADLEAETVACDGPCSESHDWMARQIRALLFWCWVLF